MNIFYLSDDPVQCAMDHCDQHVLRMTEKYAQILSNVHHLVSRKDAPLDILKPVQTLHPCSQWAAKSYWNYQYLSNLWVNLLEEYKFRYDKVHKLSHALVPNLVCPPVTIEQGEFTDPPQLVPDHCKSKDTAAAYRMYYLLVEGRDARYDHCNKPGWM